MLARYACHDPDSEHDRCQVKPCLHLDSNSLCAASKMLVCLKGAQTLAELKSLSSLESCVLLLDHNEIHESGAAALATMYSAPALQHLTFNLKQNKVGNGGAAALANLNANGTTNLKSLELNLQNNCMSDSGHQAFGDLRKETTLQELKLSHNTVPEISGPKISFFPCMG